MTADPKTQLANAITLHSADWWDDPKGFYPAYFTAEDLERCLPDDAKQRLLCLGFWPPPPDGLTLVTTGNVVAGDARNQLNEKR